METFDGAIGIDLGTTYSRVAVLHDDHLHVLTNKYNNCNFPSCVLPNNTGKLIQLPKYELYSVVKPENTVYDFKRLIGREFTDECVQNDIEHWPFKVVDRGDNTPVVQVKVGNQPIKYTAEEISTTILKNMKEAAEKYLHKKVKKAVITVPANFNDAQCEATKKAAELAGLVVLRIINEPTAAAVAYGYHEIQDSEMHNVLVCNFGGGEFEVSLLTAFNGAFNVRSTDNDTHISGEDFDNCLVDFFCGEIEREYNLPNSAINKATKRLIQLECMRVKEVLSSETSATFKIEPLFDNIKYEYNITREEFEGKCDILFEKVKRLVNHVLKYLKMSKGVLNKIILAGGSTRIPKIQSLLQSYFDWSLVIQSVNVDEVTVRGAAKIALNSNGDHSTEFHNQLVDNKLKYGIRTSIPKMSYILNFEHPDDTKNPRVFLNRLNQTEARVEIYKYSEMKLNSLLPEKVYKIVGLPSRPEGTLFIYVKLFLNLETENVTIKAYKNNNENENNVYSVIEWECTRSDAENDFLLNKETYENRSGGKMYIERAKNHLEQIESEIEGLENEYSRSNISQETQTETELLRTDTQAMINSSVRYTNKNYEIEINLLEKRLNELREHLNVETGAAFPQAQQEEDQQDDFDQGAAFPQTQQEEDQQDDFDQGAAQPPTAVGTEEIC